jgi:hypothetical protein
MWNFIKRKKWLISGLFTFVVLASVIGVSIGTEVQPNSSPITIGVGQTVIRIGDSAAASGTVDYVCDGTDDNIQFQGAIDALPAGGGEIQVLTGNYDFANGTTVTRAIANVTIRGVGRGSYFTCDGATAIFTAGGNNWTISNLRTDAGSLAMGATTGWSWENVTINATYYAYRTDDATTASSWNIPTGRTATYVVAASDAPAHVKAQADYVCDGTADNFEIQAAIDAVTGGGIIHFSTGLFRLTDEIVMTDKDGIIIEGEGIFNTTSPVNGTWLLQDTDNKSVFVLSSCQGVIFRDFSVSANTTTGTVGIELVAACNRILFEDLYLLGFDTLFDVSGACTELTWDNVLGGQGTTNYGIKMSTGQDISITKSFFPTSANTGKSIYLSSVSWVSITGNELRDSGFITGQSNYITITNNTFGGLDYPGIEIYGNSAYPGNIVISSNNFDACAANTTPGNPEDSNIYAHGDGGGYPYGLIISENTFERGINPHPYYGMYLANLGKNRVTDNLLTNGYYNTPICLIATASGFTYPYNNTGYIAPSEIRTASGSLTGGAANAILFAWHNPELQDIYIKKVIIVITTADADAANIDCGIADDATYTNGGTEFFDDLPGETIAVDDSYIAGDGGKQTKWVFCQDSASATDGWVVAKILTNDGTSIAGSFYIEYVGK